MRILHHTDRIGAIDIARAECQNGAFDNTFAKGRIFL